MKRYVKTNAWMLLCISLASILTILSCQSKHEETNSVSEEDAVAIGTEAYIYGYPLVTMEMTRSVMTNVVEPEDGKAPMGQFANSRTYPSASFQDVTAPNADTLYSTAWVDLTEEPFVLHVPKEDGRYYLMPMLSGWTDVFASPGKRTTGTDAADFAITGPGWKGTLPAGLKEFKSPTNMVWILGRTYCTGTPEDYEAVHAIQDQYSLTPLSYFGSPYYVKPKGTVNSHIDMQIPVRIQVNKMHIEPYFNLLAKLMQKNPPSKEDAPILAKMAKIGIIPGQAFDLAKLDEKTVQAFKQIPNEALKKINAHIKTAGKDVNGWIYLTKTGTYGTDYLYRALVAMIGLGANLPQDAIYPFTDLDHGKRPLNGAYRYVIHFPPGGTPPVQGFWSLTLYNSNYFFIPNTLNRYSLSPRNPLKYNEDGSLDLYIQHDKPTEWEKEANWLPAPKDAFILMFRFYWPDESVINGAWKPPIIKRL